MKKIALILTVFLFVSGCGYKAVQTEYYKTVREQMRLKHERSEQEPLVNIKTPDGYHIVVQDPYKHSRKDVIQVRQPRGHPGYTMVGKALTSPLASVLAGGYAGKMLLQEAGTHTINSNNSAGGDMASSYKGGASVSESFQDHSSNDYSDNSVTDKSDNSVTDNSDDSVTDKSDNSVTDQSVSDSYNEGEGQ